MVGISSIPEGDFYDTSRRRYQWQVSLAPLKKIATVDFSSTFLRNILMVGINITSSRKFSMVGVTSSLEQDSMMSVTSILEEDFNGRFE